MQEASSTNPYIPQESQISSTHIINTQDLLNKDKTRYKAHNWYDKFINLFLMGLGMSGFLAVLAILDPLSFLIYLTPLPPIAFASVWLVKRLFYGKDLETLR